LDCSSSLRQADLSSAVSSPVCRAFVSFVGIGQFRCRFLIGPWALSAQRARCPKARCRSRRAGREFGMHTGGAAARSRPYCSRSVSLGVEPLLRRLLFGSALRWRFVFRRLAGFALQGVCLQATSRLFALQGVCLQPVRRFVGSFFLPCVFRRLAGCSPFRAFVFSRSGGSSAASFCRVSLGD
jgi:hypothetical protein